MPTTLPARIRNVAIIAHIDHGKTTLIDAIFRAAHVFRENARIEERVMDSHDLERERGITIRSKHCTVEWADHRINIIDTPGHADFSGEVERVLSMVDSVLLLVDANEGPMPQTRYVLMRALRLGMRPLVIINKADRPNADPQRALDLTFDLFLELGATDHQADFPVLYGSGLEGWLVRDLDADEPRGMDALFEAIIAEVPAPHVDPEAPFSMQVSTLAWSDYIGRIGCGRVLGGRHRLGTPLTRMVTRYSTAAAATDTTGGPAIYQTLGANGSAQTQLLQHVALDTIGSPSTAPFEVTFTETVRSTHLWVTDGLGRAETEEIGAGDIVWLSGPADLSIGDTLCTPPVDEAHARAVALPPLEIEEPTVSMFFLVNTGPFAGNEGRAVTLRQIRDRLEREARVNVALRVEDLGRSDGLKVSGRGELHLAILIEEMRREGMELNVSRPEVITHRDAKGKLLEPYEELTIEVPEEYQGIVIEKLSRRKGDLTGMQNHGSGTARLEFRIPTRGLLGYRTEFLTDTRGLGIMTARVTGYGKWAGEVAHRDRGSLVSMDTGVATGYQLESLQSRGTMFVSPMDRVYVGMVIGEHTRPDDLVCNPTKTKKLGNYRSENKEIDTGLKAVRILNLDQALEWIADDELVEVTPTSVRIRKTLLDFEDRRRAEKRSAALEPA